MVEISGHIVYFKIGNCANLNKIGRLTIFVLLIVVFQKGSGSEIGNFGAFLIKNINCIM